MEMSMTPTVNRQNVFPQNVARRLFTPEIEARRAAREQSTSGNPTLLTTSKNELTVIREDQSPSNKQPTSALHVETSPELHYSLDDLPSADDKASSPSTVASVAAAARSSMDLWLNGYAEERGVTHRDFNEDASARSNTRWEIALRWELIEPEFTEGYWDVMDSYFEDRDAPHGRNRLESLGADMREHFLRYFDKWLESECCVRPLTKELAELEQQWERSRKFNLQHLRRGLSIFLERRAGCESGGLLTAAKARWRKAMKRRRETGERDGEEAAAQRRVHENAVLRRLRAC